VAPGVSSASWTRLALLTRADDVFFYGKWGPPGPLHDISAERMINTVELAGTATIHRYIGHHPPDPSTSSAARGVVVSVVRAAAIRG